VILRLRDFAIAFAWSAFASLVSRSGKAAGQRNIDFEILRLRDFENSYAGIFFCRYLFLAANKRGGER